jgi:hypothetical protein
MSSVCHVCFGFRGPIIVSDPVVHLTGLAHRLSTVLAQLTPLLSFTGFDLYPFCRCPDFIILLLIQSLYKHVLIAPNIS